MAVAMIALAADGSPLMADEAAQPSSLQMAFQLGGVLEASSGGTGPAATLDLFWFPWRIGGIWSEFGVLEPEHDVGFALEPLSSTVQQTTTLSARVSAGISNHQHLEGSLGFILGGTEKSAGYLRGGIGAYRIETAEGSRKVLSNGPPVPYFSNVRWAMGVNLAAGARFAQPTWRAQPMFELRAHILPGDYDSGANVLLSVSGGVWFR